jgi:hypothetical protein
VKYVMVAIPVWAALSLLTLAGFNADWRASVTCVFPKQFSQRAETKQFREVAIISALPVVGWFVGFGATGAYSDGLTFYHGPCTSSEIAYSK